MPATYPRTDHPHLDLREPRQLRQDVASLHELSKSMGGRLIVQTFLNVRGDEAGFHGSKSVEGQNHLTIKNEAQITTARGKVKRQDVGHILSDGTFEDFGSPYPSLEWLKKGDTIPGMEAIAHLQGLRSKGRESELKHHRRELRAKLSENGIAPR